MRGTTRKRYVGCLLSLSLSDGECVMQAAPKLTDSWGKGRGKRPAEQAWGNGKSKSAKGDGKTTKNMDKVKCFNCQQYGHMAANCPKKAGSQNGKAGVSSE